MVRILSNEISKITKRPGKKALTVIAQKIVKTYPNSFQHEIEGSVVGSGYDSLLKQLQARFDNLNRKSNDNTSKRKWEDSLGTEVNDMSTPGSTKKIYLHDNYANYMPNDYPDGESETTQEEKKALLQQKYKLRQNDEVEGLMKGTYASQRKDLIENKMDVPNLQITWPYLFEQVGMFVHFKELTGISIKEKMDSALMLKGKKILKWMEEDPSKHIRKIREELFEAQASISNGNAEATAVICAVASYLHEEEKSLYTYLEAAATKTEIQDLPKTPCLIGFGETRLCASRYMLSIYGVIVNDHIATFAVGLAMLFACYYNLNIMYPLTSALTLEFIQRCFVGINPGRGSKIEIKKTCKRYSQIYPKVLSLINAITDVAWRS